MGTRSKQGSKKQPTQSVAQQAQPPQQVAQQSPPAETAVEAPTTMRKGVYLSALVYVEGNQAPADDFVAAAKSALSDALAGHAPDGYTLTVKKAQAQNDVEDDGEDGGDKSSKSAKPSKDSFEF